MEIKTGYLYHIKNEYLDIANDDNLMQNNERGKKPHTLLLKKKILWFIPISSKVDKYQKNSCQKSKKIWFLQYNSY